jgi:hypothetical protein
MLVKVFFAVLTLAAIFGLIGDSSRALPLMYVARSAGSSIARVPAQVRSLASHAKPGK